MLGLKQMADHTLLLKNADLLCTMAAHPEKGPPAKTAGQANDHCGAEIKNGGLFARNGVIEAVGETQDLPNTADKVIDMTAMWSFPAWSIPIITCFKILPRRSRHKTPPYLAGCKPFIRSGAILARTIFTGQTRLAWPN